jgi:5-methylcytosine-specific restriction endonuclease McrA
LLITGQIFRMHTAADSFPALVLNADFRPLSYFPLSLWCWQDTAKAVFLDRVNVLSEYDRVVHSPTVEFRLPSVIALKDYVSVQQRPAFTRFNVFLRDRFTCQYCGKRHRTEDLTFDHVIPISRGGRTVWSNVVAACAPCNLQKGNRLPGQGGMKPLTAPAQPTTWQLQQNGRAFPPNFLHESWHDFLYWDSELED